MSQRHTNLVAWQRADDLFLAIHKTARGLPIEERYALSSQMRRAAYSVAANIVEGFARRSIKDRLYFLNIAESSLAEVAYCLHVANRLGYLKVAQYTQLDGEARRVAAPLVGLIHAAKRELAATRKPSNEFPPTR